MDPNPNSFPILSYVLSRLPHSLSLRPRPSPSPSPSDLDLEQPPVSSLPSSSASAAADEIELIERLPGLKDPAVLAAMSRAVSDVAQTRAVLRALGDRPDHEAVDAARSRLALIDSDLAHRLEEIVLSPRPSDVDRLRWRAEQAELEKECRAAADEERRALCAVLQLDEMHEAYGALLRDAEERLNKIYRSATDGSSIEDEGGSGGGGEVEQVNEEVVGILQGASGTCLERVDLTDRGLKHLPEAFGKLRGLLYLNVSHNLLEVIPDAIAGLDCLEELRLSSNSLVALPDSIGLLSNLKILDVSGNKLRMLPDSISHCRSLVELDASYNELTYLPTNIGYELVNLQKLWVHLNKLRSLPMSVCEMSSLNLLDAHFNELRGLPNAFGKLISLETLNLSSNFSDLRELPASFGDLINLRELDLSNNQIHALPDTFGRLDKLEKLNLEQNPLVLPPPEIVNEGVGAIKEFMAKRWLEILLQEEQKSMAEEKVSTPRAAAGWLTRSVSSLNSWVSEVSGSVAGYMGAREKSPDRDPYLEQQL